MSQLPIILDVRWYRGLDIALKGRIAKAQDGGHAYVQSQHNPKTWYRVSDDGKCECPDRYYRGVICKHIFAIVLKWGDLY